MHSSDLHMHAHTLNLQKIAIDSDDAILLQSGRHNQYPLDARRSMLVDADTACALVSSHVLRPSEPFLALLTPKLQHFPPRQLGWVRVPTTLMFFEPLLWRESCIHTSGTGMQFPVIAHAVHC